MLDNLFDTRKFSKKRPAVNKFFHLIISRYILPDLSGLSRLDADRSELYGLWVGCAS